MWDFICISTKLENLICAVRDPEGGHLRESRGNDQNGAGEGWGWCMVGTVLILDLGTGYMDKSCR